MFTTGLMLLNKQKVVDAIENSDFGNLWNGLTAKENYDLIQ